MIVNIYFITVTILHHFVVVFFVFKAFTKLHEVTYLIISFLVF